MGSTDGICGKKVNGAHTQALSSTTHKFQLRVGDLRMRISKKGYQSMNVHLKQGVGIDLDDPPFFFPGLPAGLQKDHPEGCLLALASDTF